MQQWPPTHAALGVCVDALIVRKKRRNALVSLHFAWFVLYEKFSHFFISFVIMSFRLSAIKVMGI